MRVSHDFALAVTNVFDSTKMRQVSTVFARLQVMQKSGIGCFLNAIGCFKSEIALKSFIASFEWSCINIVPTTVSQF